MVAILAAALLSALSALAGCGPDPTGSLKAEPQRELQGGKVAAALSMDGTRVAEVVAWARTPSGPRREIVVQLPYVDEVGYHLESLSIELTAEGSIQPEMWMEPPPYPWETTSFHRIEHGLRFEVPSLGDYGRGSVDFRFWVAEAIALEDPLRLRVALEVPQGEGVAEIRLDLPRTP